MDSDACYKQTLILALTTLGERLHCDMYVFFGFLLRCIVFNKELKTNLSSSRWIILRHHLLVFSVRFSLLCDSSGYEII